MTITLKEAMQIGGLKECRVAAGRAGLEKEITYVTIMEVPDIVRWLKGNELLLTSMYPIKDDLRAQERLIAELHERGTAALAIKPNRFIQDIPPVLLEEADRLGFPVLEIPEHISYLDILSPVMNRIFDRKAVLQEDIEAAYHLLNEISLSRSGVRHFMDVLRSLTKHEIAIESLVPFLDDVLDPSPFQPLTQRQIKEIEHLQRPVRLTRYSADGVEVSCITAPVLIDGMLYGVISSWDQEFDHLETDLAVFERAAAILSLEFMRRKVKYEVEFQYKREFLRKLLEGSETDPVELREQAAVYNIRPERGYVCCAIHFGRPGEESGYSGYMAQFENVLRSVEPEAVLGTMHQTLYLLYPAAGRKRDRMKTDLQMLIREFGRLVQAEPYAGVSREADTDITALKGVCEEARLALSISRSLELSGENYVHYDELGIFRLLVNVVPAEELNAFYQETIGILAAYDEQHQLDLVRSLEAYFEQNESMSAAAESLYIHVNTLKYRLQRVSSLTGQSIQTSEGKLNLQVGLKIGYFMHQAHRNR
ncbi:PucR family transcriptional regulator [Alkalicoccus urumqiensis]|uniref:PucR family transcriptional regulator n=1 Tax=Alkalicoccus urumqiensis TaxID=1548213 RepID=A0A2P6MLW0_ALKUR|nr:PucR family transcriptional regulator [Alkalicoccus urumqiensis]PRO67284.1 hypothetical protein C6I21_01620 [Alkalicoccus urumqiensis]